jgi:hypothetical protein
VSGKELKDNYEVRVDAMASKLQHFELDRYWLTVARQAFDDALSDVWGHFGWPLMITASIVVLAAIFQFFWLGWNTTVENLKIVGTSLLAGAVVLAALFVMRLVRKPCELNKDLTERLGALQKKDQINSLALATLPVWRQDVRVEVLKLCHGITLDPQSTLFLFAKIISDVDVSILNISARVFMSYGKYECMPVKDFSEWILVREIMDDSSRRNTQDIPLETVSLWRQLEEGNLRAGIHKQGWLGFSFPRNSETAFTDIQHVQAISMTVEDGRRIIYRDRFDSWQETSDKVIDATFRKH